MKKTLFFSTVLLILFLNSCTSSPESDVQSKTSAEQNFKFDTTMLKSGETFYQCPMDLEVISDKQGVCPKCGMELEKIEKK